MGWDSKEFLIACKDCGRSVYTVSRRRLYCVLCQDKHHKECEATRRRKATVRRRAKTQ